MKYVFGLLGAIITILVNIMINIIIIEVVVEWSSDLQLDWSPN